jgi:chromosome segregation ATPase
MSLEERIELHEQWIRSIESNLSRVSDQQAVFEVHQARLTEAMTQLAAALVTLAGRMDTLAGRMDALAEQHRKLVETVERYIRFRGNGREN